MFNTIVGAGAALRYGSGSDQKMRLLAAPAPKLCYTEQRRTFFFVETGYDKCKKVAFFVK
jgi:hypothetical protein